MTALPLAREFLAFTCIDAPVESVRDSVLSVLAGWYDSSLIADRLVPQRDFVLPTQSYNPPSNSVTLWEPRSRAGCVFMAGLTDGWSSLVHNLARKHGHSCLQIRASTDAVDYAIREWCLYRGGEERRFIRVMRDEPRWDYFTKGAPMDFEVPDDQLPRRIAHRFTTSMLLDYSTAVGWDLSTMDAWTPQGEAVEIVARYAAG